MIRNLLCCGLLLSVLIGCGQNLPPAKTPLAAVHQKFIKIYEEEIKEAVVLKEIGQTLWIYLPMKENLIEVKAASQLKVDAKKPETKPVVRYLEGIFKNQSFHIDYDIASNKTYNKSYGYASSYSEAYQNKQRRLFDALQRCYLEADLPPQFIVYIIADTTNGVESENILYFKDLKEAMTVSQEEYLKRAISELRGNPNIMDDAKGRHLKYVEITMPDFLMKQIINRVNFKYQRSSFPPAADTVSEIKNILTETFQAYEFRDFQSVELNDLDAGKTTTILRTELN